MQYMLIFRETDAQRSRKNDPEGAQAYWGAWMAYVGAVQGAGIVVSGAGLEPPDTGVTVRVSDGARHVQDGPYADSKEQLGGYFVIDVPSLDEAIAWAARSPSSSGGSTEVRQVLPPPKL